MRVLVFVLIYFKLKKLILPHRYNQYFDDVIHIPWLSKLKVLLRELLTQRVLSRCTFPIQTCILYTCIHPYKSKILLSTCADISCPFIANLIIIIINTNILFFAAFSIEMFLVVTYVHT